jgi:type VI protein secretion system component VasK
MFIGRARVDGRFTRDAIEKRIKPLLTELPVFIENLAIAQKDKSIFLNLLFKEVDAYGRRYAQYYRKYYMEFDIKAASPGALRYVLSQMVLPSSPLMEVLLTMRDNTQIDPGKNQYLLALAQKLAEFDFVRRLMSEQKGAFTELDKYRALLEQMQMDMQDQLPAVKKEKDEAIAILKDRLTPLGRISLAIYRGEQDSYLNLTKLWLSSVGVPTQWQDVFLAPIWQAYFLGMTEVETDIGKIWAELRQADIYPLYNKFPFEITSGEDISIDVLKNATYPSGRFWQTFQKMLAPFCMEEGGSWRRRAGPFDYPKLPTNMLSTVNTVAKLSSLLWDKEGKERPFEFMMRPSPLPQARPNEPIAVLSYLNAGESSVFGFNQQPSWKKIKVSWQNQSKASVGVEFTTTDRSSKAKRAIEVPNSNWSFYRLLLKTEEYAAASKFYDSSKGAKSTWIFSGDSRSSKVPRTLTWVIDSPSSSDMVKKFLAREVEGRPLEIKFTIQSDPWSLFRLSR